MYKKEMSKNDRNEIDLKSYHNLVVALPLPFCRAA